jgi:hypothetical protein
MAAGEELQRQARAYGWDGLMTGYTGQYGYNGPVMHESEYIGGRLSESILALPGWYVAVVVYSATEEQGPDGEDVAGWAVAYREVRSEDDGPWVDVVFTDGDDWDVIRDMDIDETIEYLSQWDYGQETEDAHTRDAYPWGSSDRVYREGGYVLTINNGLGYASLNRRPMGDTVTA